MGEKMETETGITNEELIEILKRPSIDKIMSKIQPGPWRTYFNDQDYLKNQIAQFKKQTKISKEFSDVGYTYNDIVKFLESYLEHK